MNPRPVRGGADVDDAPPSPSLRLSRLVPQNLPHPSVWIHSREPTVIANLGEALRAATPSLPHVSVGSNDAVILGGSLAPDDVAATRTAIQNLSTSVDEALASLPAPASAREAAHPDALCFRLRPACVEPLVDPRKHHALVVLSTIEWFPTRAEIATRLREAILRELGDDALRRFGDCLWARPIEASSKLSPRRRAVEDFLRFMQEYGMSRVRVHVALDWLDAMVRAIDDTAAQLRGARYAAALRMIVERAGHDLPQRVAVGDLGDIRPLAWSGATFVSILPLVPRADCEIAEGETAGEVDDLALRRGHDRETRRTESTGRPVEGISRHVSYVARFNATGPVAGRDAPCRTTLESGWALLQAAREDGRLDGRKGVDGAERWKLLRAIERQLVVRAAVRYARSESTDPMKELAAELALLGGDAAGRGAALGRILDGYDPRQAPSVHGDLEALSESVAASAGRLRGGRASKGWELRFVRDIFEESERSPFIAPRAEGDAGSGAPWAWMRHLQVTADASDAEDALRVGVRVQLEPLVLSWSPRGDTPLIHRERPDALTVVLAHEHPKGDERNRFEQARRRLGVSKPDLAILLPGAEDPRETFSSGRPLADRRHRARTAAAVLLARVVLDRWLARVDPGGTRALQIVAVYDRSPEEDTVADATLRAVSRALDSTNGPRPLVSQGATLEGALTNEALVAAVRSSLASLGALSMPRRHAPAAGVLGVLVLAGRPVDCVRSESGRAPRTEGGKDLLWGSAYVATVTGETLRIERSGHFADVARIEDHWPLGVIEAVRAMRTKGASLVALVAHRAFERRTFRAEARNRLYDADLPLDLLARSPACEGVRFVSLVSDGITGIAADSSDGTLAKQAHCIVADGRDFAPTTSFEGLRPLVAVATNRTLRRTLGERGERGERRIGLRRRIDLYLERSHTGEALAEAERGLLADALVGLHLLEGETVVELWQGDRLLVPVLRPHRVFDIERQPDAGELTWQQDHAVTTVNLVALATVVRSFTGVLDATSATTAR
jgi:hypothetical protein